MILVLAVYAIGAEYHDPINLELTLSMISVIAVFDGMDARRRGRQEEEK